MALRAGYSLDSEYRALKAVMVCSPGRRLGGAYDPAEVLHDKALDPGTLDKEYGALAGAYTKLKIRVHDIDPRWIRGTDRRYIFNLMFARDLFFMTPSGAIVSRMACRIRRDEALYAARALKASGIRVRKIIRGSATFEGADALWVAPGIVAVGVGNRTNEEGFRQIEEELKPDGIRCVALPAPKGVIHLLGALQFVDRNLALVRAALVDPQIPRFLKKSGIRGIEVAESGEISRKHALNFVTIAPRKIVMGAGCPETKQLLRRNKIEIAAEIPATQLINGGGGLACATGVLSRG